MGGQASLSVLLGVTTLLLHYSLARPFAFLTAKITFLKINHSLFWKFRSRRPEVFCENYILKNFVKFTGNYWKTHKKRDSGTSVFSCKSCEIIKNIFFYRTPPVAASENSWRHWWIITEVHKVPVFYHRTIVFVTNKF